MTSVTEADLRRPYLVIPKLIDQPTWGGQYIVENKGWAHLQELRDLKIGQSYELFSGSNLSQLESSQDPRFIGELSDRDAVQVQTEVEGAISLAELLAISPEGVLGAAVVAERGPAMELLVKFTQALGNSFQVHIKAGTTDPRWKPKPESWYYFQPGLLTIGLKPDADWAAYRQAVERVDAEMTSLGKQVEAGQISYDEAQPLVQALLETYDPWQYVNTVPVGKDELVDLSGGGIHHSWEEDPVRAPLGNVLYELQLEAMDDVSTFRSFDKGKMGRDGAIRAVHIEEYFKNIDRTPATNAAKSHFLTPKPVTRTDEYELSRLLETAYYNLDKLSLKQAGAAYHEAPGRFKHLFVKAGGAKITAGGHTLTVTTGHSCFVPAAVGSYQVESLDASTEILISS